MSPTCQCRRLKSHRFDPWVGKIPGEGHGNPVFLPGESCGQRSLVGYSPCSHKESDITDVTEHVANVRGKGEMDVQMGRGKSYVKSGQHKE